MNCILLTKYVPDITRITDSSFDSITGNLKRATLPGVTNPDDISAMSLLDRLLKSKGDKTNNVIALTMGPADAVNALYDALSTVADKAYHLIDKLFAGSDTWATAQFLTKAIKQIAQNEFHGEPYIVVAGMQSCDGDTAQVPPQVAAGLGVPVVSYALTGEIDDGKFNFSCIAQGGDCCLAVGEESFMLTVAPNRFPIYPSFCRARWAKQQQIHNINAEQLGVSESGIQSSRTRVINIFRPEGNKRKHKHIKSIEELAEIIYENATASQTQNCAEDFIEYRPDNQQEVWVVAEPSGKLANCTSQLLAEARKLASELGGVCCCLCFGDVAGDFIGDAAIAGADKVYRIANSESKQSPTILGHYIAELISAGKPNIVLFGATLFGRVVAPIAAYKTGNGLTADCTGLELRDDKTGTPELIQTRPALGGNIMASIRTIYFAVSMATVRPGRFNAIKSKAQRQCEVVEYLATEITAPDIEVVSESINTFEEDFTGDIIISGGRGLGSKDNFKKCLVPVKKALENACNCTVTLGASRAAVEAGFTQRHMQVGQTGKTVAPNLYISVGISGAIQHIVGIDKSCVIISINNDPTSPILMHSDYYYIGDAVQSLQKIQIFLEGKR